MSEEMREKVAIEEAPLLIGQFSAIPSLIGYEYQGHIALYVAIKTLKSFLEEEKVFDEYILEFEGAEDFSIKESDTYLSLHQVKNGAVNLSKEDKFAFVISLLQYGGIPGFYHILPNKKLSDDFVVETLNHINYLQSELNKEVRDADEVVEDEEDNYIITKKVSGNSSKASVYDIIKSVYGGDKSKENIQKTVETIKERLTHFKSILTEGSHKGNIELVVQYNPSFKSIQEIEVESSLIIKEILEIERKEWSLFVDDDYSMFVYEQVFQKFQKNIVQDYESERYANKVSRLSFNILHGILLTDFREELNSRKYRYYLVWKGIMRSYEEFPSKNQETCESECCVNCNKKQICNLHNQMEFIRGLDDEARCDLIYKLMLEEPETNPNNMPIHSLITRLFTRLLKEVEILRLEDSNLILAQKNEDFYRLSLNSCVEKEEFQSLLSKEFQKNWNHSLLTYETDVLITDHLDEDEFRFEEISVNILGSNEYKEVEDISGNSLEGFKKNCTKQKPIRLISRKNVKEELSND